MRNSLHAIEEDLALFLEHPPCGCNSRGGVSKGLGDEALRRQFQGAAFARAAVYLVEAYLLQLVSTLPQVGH